MSATQSSAEVYLSARPSSTFATFATFATSSTLAVLFVAAVAPSALFGAQSLPTPQELAARHDSLVGGRAAVDAHRSVRLIGSFSLPAMGLDAPLEILKVKPNKYLFRSSLGQIGEMLSGHDGTTAWSVQPGQGAMIMTGAQAAQMAQQADFFGDLHDLAKFATVETIDVLDFEGKRAHRVRMIRQNGDTVTEYFDAETGLSAGVTTSVETPMGRLEATTLYSEYKEFGGLRLATRIVQRSQQFELILAIAAVEFDSIDEASVAPPDAIKVLIKPSAHSPRTRQH